MIYLIPYFDNPRGVSMPLERRSQIVEIAKRWSRPAADASLAGKIYVVSDDAYRELRYAGEDTPGTRTVDEEGDTVIVAGTFSKSYSPGVRVGWGILPRPLVEPVCSQKGNFDFGSPNFNQHLMATVIEMGLFDTHVRRIRENYGGKLEAMLKAASDYLSPLPGVRWLRPSGGLYIWVRLPQEVAAGPTGRLFDTAIRKGVLYVPGEYCYASAGEPVERNTIRLSFGVKSCEQIRQGVETLGEAIREVVSEGGLAAAGEAERQKADSLQTLE
jgi:2-aminoadipate transaminase